MPSFRTPAVSASGSGRHPGAPKSCTTTDVYTFRVEEPQLRRVGILFNDITERKRAEEKLRASEERFRAFTSATSDVVYRMSPDWAEMRQLDGREFIADTPSQAAHGSTPTFIQMTNNM